MYDFTNNNLPANITPLFSFANTGHNYGTRLSIRKGLNLPMVKSEKQKTHIAPFNWNKYCLTIQDLNSKSKFVKKLKNKLINSI